MVGRFAFIGLCASLITRHAFAQPSNVTINYNTTINDSTYANSIVTVQDGATPPTVVSVEDGASLYGLTVRGSSIINFRDGKITIDGLEDPGGLKIYGGTLNYYGGSLSDHIDLKAGVLNLMDSTTIRELGVNNGVINCADGVTLNGRVDALDVTVSGNGTIDWLICTGTLTMSSGAISLDLIGTANISGGSVGGWIEKGAIVNAFDGYFHPQSVNGNMNVYGGKISVMTGLTGIANVYGGSITLGGSNRGVVNVYGGSGNYYSESGSVVNVFGGSASPFTIGGVANIYGGSVNSAGFIDGGTINFHGYDLQYDASSGIVTGILKDGTPIHCTISRYYNTSGTVNLINEPPASISGALLFHSLVVDAEPQNVVFTFRPSNGAPPITQTLAVSPFGAFTLPGLPREAGTLHIKPEKFLAVNVAVDLSGGDVSGVNAKLQSGDANNDNSVDTTDFGILVGAYNSGSALPGSGYDPTADFNGDGSVDTTDFGILVGSYNLTGDP